MSEIEIDPVDHITVGAVGLPGSRTFMLQVESAGSKTVLILEKEQVVRLFQIVHLLFAQYGYPQTSVDPNQSTMDIDPDAEPSFRAGAMSLAYEESRDLVVIECDELVDPEDEPPGPQGQRARFWVTREQLASLASQGMRVATQGRPICPYCLRPMDDPEHHLCRRMNGHSESEEE